jgi:predicted nucleic-acid-binding protein
LLALDSNVLVRYLVQDDREQTRIAADFIESRLSSAEPGFVSLIVLCEIAWTLRAGYGFSPAEVRDTLIGLSAAGQLTFEREEIVERALSQSRYDPADVIIHELGRAAGCAATVTFDRRFARMDGVRLLAKSTKPTGRSNRE